MRETRTSGSNGRGLETGSRRRLNGHKAGNGGHRQAEAYGVPRQPSTLPVPARPQARCPPAPRRASARPHGEAHGTDEPPRFWESASAAVALPCRGLVAADALESCRRRFTESSTLFSSFLQCRNGILGCRADLP
jgi:hypothetical protein